jgi:hypothetical protein
MTTPPADGPSSSDPDSGRWAAPDQPSDAPDPVSLDKPEPPFDPYRFGAPEHPIPAEYAPPGYTPPPATAPPPPYVPPQPTHGYQGQGYGYPAPPNSGQQYPQPRTGNGKAIAALVLGILAIVFCWTSIFDAVFVVLAIVFGFLGLSDAKRSGGGRGMAMAGLICGLAGAVAAILFSVWILSRVGPCIDDFDRGSSAQRDCINSRF